eukprot:TRINITY_DN1928_c1_g1_i7.p1 TRINITY_DN1928_c1_g1~~TRINITY_DN1928_c1_g1_i7.p1  ORF type:complete len:719 (+),score=67.89 TRINITY_DN1928_c1_g1_i7:114-2159(+)
MAVCTPPPTPAPATPSPPTPAPATPSPATPAPATPSPPTKTASVTLSDIRMLPVVPTPSPPVGEVGGGTDTLSGLTSLASGGPAGRFALLRATGCYVNDVDLGFGTALDFEFHPLGVALGSGPERYLVGAVVLNIVLVLGVGGVSFCCAIVFCKRNAYPTSYGLALLRLPGMMMVPYLALLPGLALVSGLLIFFPRMSASGVSVALGVVGLVVICIVPVMLHRRVLRHVADKAFLMADPRLYPQAGYETVVLKGRCLDLGRWRGLYRWCYGDYLWVSVGFDSGFADQLGVVFDSFTQRSMHTVQVEIALHLFLGFISAWKPPPGMYCNVRNGIISVLFCAFLAFLLWRRPYVAAVDAQASLLVASTTALAMVLMTAAIATEAPRSDSGAGVWAASSWLLYIGTVVMCAKGVLDLCLIAFDICIGRRMGTRAYARTLVAKGHVNAETLHRTAMELLDTQEGQAKLQSYLPEVADDVAFTQMTDVNLAGSGSMPTDDVTTATVDTTQATPRPREAPDFLSGSRSLRSPRGVDAELVLTAQRLGIDLDVGATLKLNESLVRAPSSKGAGPSSSFRVISVPGRGGPARPPTSPKSLGSSLHMGCRRSSPRPSLPSHPLTGSASEGPLASRLPPSPYPATPPALRRRRLSSGSEGASDSELTAPLRSHSPFRGGAPRGALISSTHL